MKLTVLWIYIALLVAGGLMGFVKGKSRASLIASVAFAIPLILCALGIITQPYVAEIVLGVLLLFFGMRFTKSRKVMPNGMMLVMTLAALLVRLLVK